MTWKRTRTGDLVEYHSIQHLLLSMLHCQLGGVCQWHQHLLELPPHPTGPVHVCIWAFLCLTFICNLLWPHNKVVLVLVLSMYWWSRWSSENNILCWHASMQVLSARRSTSFFTIKEQGGGSCLHPWIPLKLLFFIIFYKIYFFLLSFKRFGLYTIWISSLGIFHCSIMELWSFLCMHLN